MSNGYAIGAKQQMPPNTPRSPSGKQTANTSPQPLLTPRWVQRWLSTGLSVVGLLLLVAGGVMTYLNSVTLAEPPPAVGLVEPPPSLEENPLPVVITGDLPTAVISPATPTPLLSPSSADQSESDFPVAVSPATPTPTPSPTSTASAAGATQETPVSPTPSPSPTPTPPPANPPTRIVVPAINLDAEIVPVGWKQIIQSGKIVSVWEVAEYAAGWHQNSSLPGGGGNIVLSGHHNVKGEVFRYLVDLEPGDTITLYADDRPYTYTVESRFVVRDKGETEEKRRENARWVDPFPDERVTLITCWPYTNNTHRVIVIAKPAANP